PTWQVYRVVADTPDGRRVSVLWNGDSIPLRVMVPKSGGPATLYDRFGRALPLEDSGAGWEVQLPAATAHA
ncbi:MAG: hypothetical protein C4345_10705, partial [Chloroflexota bacterium]